MFCQNVKLMDLEERVIRIGQCVRTARERAGLSQDEVAERLGLQGKGRASMISRWESGQRGLPAEQVVPLSEVLGCSPSYIVGADEEDSPSKTSPREAAWILVRYFDEEALSR